MENNNEEKLENKKKINIKLKTIVIISVIVATIIIGIIVYATITNNSKCNKATNYRTSINSITSVNLDPGLMVDAKPIIYLYPRETTQISVKLGKPENITCSYPEYKNGWNVIAKTDGTLIDTNTGRKLYSLYWEGMHSEPINFEEGFIVKGDDILHFLEEKLSILGLNEYETEEFIIYWLPRLKENKYNYIRFATIDEINKNMPLEFSVKPDTIIRILMQYKAVDDYIEIKEQKIETPKREGFVAVEWGGTEIK